MGHNNQSNCIQSNLPILQRGEPVLAQVAQAINNVETLEIQQLIADLKLTVAEAKGVGIAAPQVGKSLRLFLMCSAPSERYPDAPLLPVAAIINPKIISNSEQQTIDWEGCLSVKGKRALVPRYHSINVSYLDEAGMKHNKTFTGFLARIFQHELDHLDGITFIERLSNEDDTIDEQQWRQQYQNQSA
jgi:peptide deformylase